MSIAAIRTEHAAWEGVRFTLNGEAELGAKINAANELQEVLAHAPPGTFLMLTTSTREILRAAMKLYWSALDLEVDDAARVEKALRSPAVHEGDTNV